jgi:glucose-induced degradation protein 4
MPTPSSNPPPGPDSPRSHSFSTCPDEAVTRSPPRHWAASSSAVPEGAIATRDATAAVDSPSATESALTSHLDASPEAMVEDEPASEPTSATSSRSTTMSPRPETASTVGTTPAPTTTDDGTSKAMEVDEEGFASSSRVRLGPRDSTAAQSHERQATSSTSQRDAISGLEWDDAELSEGELMAPSMGSDYPSLRVSRVMHRLSTQSIDKWRPDDSFISLLVPEGREQVPRHTAV